MHLYIYIEVAWLEPYNSLVNYSQPPSADNQSAPAAFSLTEL